MYVGGKKLAYVRRTRNKHSALVDRGRGEAPHQTPPDDVRTTGCRRDKNEVGRINYYLRNMGWYEIFFVI